jgi:hypothetical protein
MWLGCDQTPPKGLCFGKYACNTGLLGLLGLASLVGHLGMWGHYLYVPLTDPQQVPVTRTLGQGLLSFPAPQSLHLPN